MKDIWLIRHAECEVNTTPRYIGGRSNSSPLTELGKEQARRLAHYLVNLAAKDEYKDLRESQFVSSTAFRAERTANVVMEMLGVATHSLNLRKDAVELDQGLWEGEERLDAYNRWVMQLIKDQGVDFRPPQGESRRQAGHRMANAINDLVLKPNGKDRILLFTHGVAIKALIWEIFKVDEKQIYLGTIDNCSITRFKVFEENDRDEMFKLVWWNNDTQV